MRIFIVYWHPEPQSFNGAMFRTAQETLTALGHEIQISDLYKMNFDPVSSRLNFTTIKDSNYFKQQIEELHATENNGFSPQIETEIQKIAWCDFMIWQFPLWWFGLPAVLKGWVDRVFAMGRVYGGGQFYENGVFQGKRAMLSLTTGGSQEMYFKDGFNGDITGILRPIQRGMLEFVGFSVLTPHIVYAPVRLTEVERKHVLVTYAERLKNIAEESPIQIGSY
jgi:NAD(P)H dehydrogenase (quinone)